MYTEDRGEATSAGIRLCKHYATALVRPMNAKLVITTWINSKMCFNIPLPRAAKLQY